MLAAKIASFKEAWLWSNAYLKGSTLYAPRSQASRMNFENFIFVIFIMKQAAKYLSSGAKSLKFWFSTGTVGKLLGYC